MTDTDIELADAIASVRDQLLDAAHRATGHPVAFEMGEIQMEFTIELRKEFKGGTKVKAWVVEAAADGTRTVASGRPGAISVPGGRPRGPGPAADRGPAGLPPPGAACGVTRAPGRPPSCGGWPRMRRRARSARSWAS